MGRLLLLGVLTYSLFLWGIITLNGQVLALTIPLMVYLGAALLFGPGKLSLKAARTLSAERALLRNRPGFGDRGQGET